MEHGGSAIGRPKDGKKQLLQTQHNLLLTQNGVSANNWSVSNHPLTTVWEIENAGHKAVRIVMP